MQRRDLVKSGLFLVGAAAAGSLVLASGSARPERNAPEFTGINGWINTDTPISVAGLRGEIMLVNFWTYSCINCRCTIPYLKRWQSEYGPLGLQIIGIRTLEFAFEHDRPNVEIYVRQTGISYPVGQDNNFRTWDAWDNEAWPDFGLANHDGRVVLVCEGEDHAHETEGAIRGLLGLSRTETYGLPADDPDLSRIGSPEMYFGSIHPTPQDDRQSPRFLSSRWGPPYSKHSWASPRRPMVSNVCPIRRSAPTAMAGSPICGATWLSRSATIDASPYSPRITSTPDRLNKARA